jgi:hypothetical protein
VRTTRRDTFLSGARIYAASWRSPSDSAASRRNCDSSTIALTFVSFWAFGNYSAGRDAIHRMVRSTYRHSLAGRVNDGAPFCATRFNRDSMPRLGPTQRANDEMLRSQYSEAIDPPS